MIDISKIIARIKKTKNIKSDRQVAEIFGISEQNFNNKKKRATLIPEIVEWALNENVNLNWLLTGEGAPPNETAPPLKKPDSEVITLHKSLIERFRDKERAKEINETLLEIERLDSEALNEIAIDLKGVAKGLRLAFRKENKNRRHGERRKTNGPDYEKSKDRRSGTDRRRASGER